MSLTNVYVNSSGRYSRYIYYLFFSFRCTLRTSIYDRRKARLCRRRILSFYHVANKSNESSDLISDLDLPAYLPAFYLSETILMAFFAVSWLLRFQENLTVREKLCAVDCIFLASAVQPTQHRASFFDTNKKKGGKKNSEPMKKGSRDYTLLTGVSPWFIRCLWFVDRQRRTG